MNFKYGLYFKSNNCVLFCSFNSKRDLSQIGMTIEDLDLAFCLSICSGMFSHLMTQPNSELLTHTGRQGILDIDMDPAKYRKVSDKRVIVAIFDSSADWLILPVDAAKYGKLYNALPKKSEKCIDIPISLKNEQTSGVMKIAWKNAEKKMWRSNKINRITPLWDNMDLKVKDFDRLPKQQSIIGLFPRYFRLHFGAGCYVRINIFN